MDEAERIVQMFWYVVAAAAIVFLAVALWALKRRGRIPLRLSPRSKVLLFAGACVFTVLFPIVQYYLLYR